ncbi:MAG: hypothetical protein Q9213_000938 [Squamulea squamosa]
MGIQAYLTRLALGRSAYEPLDYEVPQAVPSVENSQQQIEHVDTLQFESHDHSNDPYAQQYDDRGYPQNLRSRKLSHRSRNAQNDVLATIGVLHVPNQKSVQEITVPPGKQGPDFIELYRDLAAESEFGLDMTAAVVIPDSLLHGRITCARQRMQPSHIALVDGRSFALSFDLARTWFLASVAIASKLDGLRTSSRRPDNPDHDSIVVALNRDENVPGLGYITDEGEYVNNITTIRNLAERDWAAFKDHFKPLTSWWRSSAADRRTYINDETEPAVYRNMLDPLSAEPGSQGAGFERGPDPQASRSGSNSWQVNVQSSEMVLTAPRSWCEPTKPADISMPTYRVTYYTALMAETVAGSLSTLVADVVLLPLEALFVRSVALAYLDTAGGAPYSNMGLRNDIFPLGSLFGMGLRDLGHGKRLLERPGGLGEDNLNRGNVEQTVGHGLGSMRDLEVQRSGFDGHKGKMHKHLILAV